MGQYHHVVCITTKQCLLPHDLGCGLKAWEQLTGGIPAALTMLLAYQPGNRPADLGNHPMTGRWAGQRILVVGDYAEDSDLPGFGPGSLSRLYGDCARRPNRANYTGTDATKLFVADKRQWDKLVESGRWIEDISTTLRGGIESSLSVRFCGDRWSYMVPVMSYAGGSSGDRHYRIPDVVPENEIKMIKRMTGMMVGRDDFGVPIYAETPQQMRLERWPWDRPPADLSWHNATDAQADDGQRRVFANLDLQEFFDPAAFGEQPTTVGIMRASAGSGVRQSVDMLVSADGVQQNVREGSSDLGSASALFCMLLHPEPRGGGDIEPELFPAIGRWRNHHLILTSERSGEFPDTEMVRETYQDISSEIIRSLATLSRA